MEALDKLLDKLGFYDLIGVLLPGITATGFSILADKIVFHIGLDKYLSTEDIFLFLIISYFVGVVLQEGGSFIMKCCDRGNKLFNYSLVPREDRRDSITEMEKEMFSKVIKKSFPEGTDPDWQMMYNFCKHSGGNTLSADKDHSVAAMSRSMGLYFAILAFCFSVSAIHNLNAYIIAAIVFSGAISSLMWYRSCRFYKIRYIRIFRNYSYFHIKQETLSQTKNKEYDSCGG